MRGLRGFPHVRVLIVEDEVKLAGIIWRGMRERGLRADVATSGEDALWMAGSTDYAAIVLDVILPGIDGFETCRRLRADGIWTPVLMLTARDAVEDRIAGLDRGADDYLVKPFAFDELLARLRALLRRGQPQSPDERLRYADVEMSPETREAWRGGESLSLTAREFDLLEFFLRHPRRVLTRARILEQVWGYDYLGGSNVIDVYVRVLREKLEVGGKPRLIQTIRGVGYALRES